MPKTILKIAQGVCDRETVNAPETLFGTNDRHARVLRKAASDTVHEIMDRATAIGVSGLAAQWAFATRPGIYCYRLPPDFYREIPNTEFRQQWSLGVYGPVGPEAWNLWLSGSEATALPMSWRIRNNLIWIEPVPTEAEVVVIDYLSNFMVTRDATASDMEVRDGYQLPKAGLVPRDGYVTEETLALVQTTTTAVWGAAVWGGSVWGTTAEAELRRIPGASDTYDGFPPFQVRQEDFQADTDVCALGDDHLLSLGMSYRLRRSLSMSFTVRRDEYLRRMDTFLSRTNGAAKPIALDRSPSQAELMPLGNGRWRIS